MQAKKPYSSTGLRHIFAIVSSQNFQRHVGARTNQSAIRNQPTSLKFPIQSFYNPCPNWASYICLFACLLACLFFICFLLLLWLLFLFTLLFFYCSFVFCPFFLIRLFTVPYFFSNIIEIEHFALRAAILDVSKLHRGGGRPLSSFDTHPSQLPVTQSARSRRSYRKIGDCEQSIFWCDVWLFLHTTYLAHTEHWAVIH